MTFCHAFAAMPGMNACGGHFLAVKYSRFTKLENSLAAKQEH